MHKGQSGKIGVLGGSKDYTGAPYYAATTSLRAGGDLVSVFAPKEAEQPLKWYSPELIVHPYDFWKINSEDDEVRNKEIEEITKWFSGLNRYVHILASNNAPKYYRAYSAIWDLSLNEF